MTEENRELLDAINNLSSIMATQIRLSNKEFDDFRSSLDTTSDSMSDYDKYIESLIGSTRGLTREQIDYKLAQRELRIQTDALKKAFQESTQSLKELGSQLISQKRGFDKYGKGIEDLTKSVGDAASFFKGKWGVAVGAAITALGKLTAAYMQQADSLLKANDELSKFGTAGTFTTKELMEMANSAGITSKNIELFTKPLTSLGPALINLGSTTGQGVKAFAELTKISNEQREQFQRMGVSQEELIQNQADYIKLQRLSGKQISLEAKDRAQLQKASLEYTENLLQLSAISGQDVNTIKQKQQLALAENNFMISNMRMQNQANELRKRGDDKQADAIEKEIKNREKLVSAVANTLDDQTRLAVTARLATGTYTEQSKGLALLGVQMEKFERQMKNGEDVTGSFLNDFRDKIQENVKVVGGASVFSKELSDTFLTSSKNLEFANQGTKDYTKSLKDAKDNLDKGKKPGFDPAQDARAKLTTLEIEAGKALDKLTAAANPLISGFNALTLGANAAVAGLIAMAAMKLPNLLGGPGAKIPGGIGDIQDKFGGKNLVGTAGKVTGLLGKAGAVGMAASAGWEIGTMLNTGINKLTEILTGKKDETFGGWLADKIHGKEEAEGKKEAKPKAAKGGIFEGPKTGYDVELHGKEMIVPLNQGKKIADLSSKNNIPNKEFEKIVKEFERVNSMINVENQNKQLKEFEKSLKENDNAFDKLVKNIIKLNEITQKEVDEKEEIQELQKKLNINVKESSGSLFSFKNSLKEFLSGMNPFASASTGGSATGAPVGGDISGYLQKVAMVESGGQAGAKASTSSASGLFQFTEGTWKQTVKEMGKDYSLQDRFDPKKSAEVAAYFTRQQQSQVEKGTGRKASEADLYMAHFLGAGGATKFLNALQKNPNAPASEGADAAQISANKTIFFNQQGQMRTLQDVYNLMSNKLGKAETQIAQGKISDDVRKISVTAAGGAIINGSNNGYPVDLTAHGREIIAPLEPNSILEMLSKTPANQKEIANTNTNTITNNSMSFDNFLASNEKLFDNLTNKITDMINILESSKSTQEQLLQVSRV